MSRPFTLLHRYLREGAVPAKARDYRDWVGAQQEAVFAMQKARISARLWTRCTQSLEIIQPTWMGLGCWMRRRCHLAKMNDGVSHRGFELF
jgi:hypothetical protein